MHVRRAAVLGAGVMGAQIAAHFVNAGIPVRLFDLKSTGDAAPTALARQAIEGLARLEPAPLALPELATWIDPASYEDDLGLLADCDLVIEAIAERLDFKLDLYRRVSPWLAQHAVLASNTSGLSIAKLAAALPETQRPRFCGVHFFNPPRYMSLVELVPGVATAGAVADALEAFLVTVLGKGVVRTRDTPNFIANRVGIFALLSALHHGARLGLGFDLVDALTGPLIGRPKSGTCRLADIVGLDTLAHVVHTMRDHLPQDPWHAHYALPLWCERLIAKGALGQKSGAGIYRREGRDILVLDPATGAYCAQSAAVAPEVEAILKQGDATRRHADLRASAHPQAQFLWSIERDLMHYCAVHLADIADCARDVDLALRWGFGWTRGPFESWQLAGWRALADAVAEDIAAGRALAPAALPQWVFDGRAGVHGPTASWSPAEQAMRPRPALPVYCRQFFPDRVAGEAQDPGTTLWETESVRLWHTNEVDGREIAVLSFKSKMNSMAPDVCAGIVEAVARAERDHAALVIWQMRPPFSAGANIKSMEQGVLASDYVMLDRYIDQFQQMTAALKYARVPVVAAVQGLALGGGCEVAMHCARIVACFDCVIGLVETGIGLIPAGGGCKEHVLRAAAYAGRSRLGDAMAYLDPVFDDVARARTARSAHEARAMGVMRDGDVAVLNPAELLFAARSLARALAATGYRPPLPARDVPVAGRAGIATLEAKLVNLREGSFISEHDYVVARAVAVALCGGEVEAGTRVDEQWLLDVERAEFVGLLRTEKTLARIQHMLKTGKPLRN